MLELQNIRKAFNTGKPYELIAVDGVDLTIEARKVTVLRGPSGSGKTTLLSLAGCMARPTSGRIMLEEREITSLPERFLTEIRRTTFGFIFQQFNPGQGDHRPGERDASRLSPGRTARIAEEKGAGPPGPF
jgi:putative ABC transport system ATP-binding protein